MEKTVDRENLVYRTKEYTYSFNINTHKLLVETFKTVQLLLNKLIKIKGVY